MGHHVSAEAGDGYRSLRAFAFAGLTYRVGDYLARTGLVRPSVAEAHGTGTRRFYSFRDLVALRAVKALRDAGLSLQRVRRAAAVLRRDWREDLADARLVTDGREAFIAVDAAALVALLDKPGQGAFRAVVDVGRIAREVREAVAREEARAA